jgi:hypothetical protein
MVFVAYQSCTPWFKARVGHLTGTTALNTIKTIKFVLLDDQNLPERIRQLLELLGLLLERKSRESISTLPVVSLKKAYKALGCKVTTSRSTPRQTMVDSILKQHPTHSLVYKKNVRSWFMAPIQSQIVESFRQGNIAESEINDNILPFIKLNTKGMTYVVQAYIVGRIKSCQPTGG